MIIQTGLRTDIPAFYSEWFAKRLTEGFVLVRSPYNHQLVTKYILSPHVVDLIGFCTKNPAPMFPYLKMLEPFGQFWFVTITPYGRDIEPHVPNKNAVIESFQELSKNIGAERVAWRYDPILIDDRYTEDYHIRAFRKMAESLGGYTDTCVISFIDLYAKVLRNFPEARAVTPAEQERLAGAFAEIGNAYGIRVKGCAERKTLATCGIDMEGCLTENVIERAVRAKLRIPKGKFLRSECRCIGGNDIGAYDSCGHLCRYCYATSDREAYARNRKIHDPSSPLLLGQISPTDKIHAAKQESWKCSQTDLFRDTIRNASD